MKTSPLRLAGIFLSLSFLSATAAVRYVNVNSASPTAPYTTWATAATSIQTAIDAATPGDQILVTNGVYQTGGRVVYGSVPNRVAVTKPLTVQSVNGAAVTTIVGSTGGTTRCVYLTNGAALMGFTLTNGATAWDAGFDNSVAGGVWGETNSFVSDCLIINNGAEWAGGVFRVTATNCVIANNSANWPGAGGGASSSVLYNCILTNNSTGIDGGGADSCTLYNCLLAGNSSGIFGGGARECTLFNCTLTNNSASSGGGAISSKLNNCIVKNNSAAWGGGLNGCNATNCEVSANSAGDGGGANGGTLVRCAIFGNNAGSGGGASSATLLGSALYRNTASVGGGVSSCNVTNCTVAGNVATSEGGGAYVSALWNSIVFYNNAPTGPNHSGSALTNSCTTPLLLGGNNLSAEPLLADFAHLSALSPCRGAGSAAFATGTDLDGEAWLNPPAMGCDEFVAGGITGALSVATTASYTNVATQFMVNFTAVIGGHAGDTRWNFGDGTIVSNHPAITHSWSAAGNYPVILTAYNLSNPGGISATVMVSVVQQPVHYVSLTSTNPIAPYFTWATAATNLQDAADAAYAGSTVLASNGVYQTGGRVVYGALTNRLAVLRPITVKSVNGAALTVIQGNPTNGDSAVRCVYLTNGTSLSGFTLTGGATRTDGDGAREQSGGGLWCESTSIQVSNCVLTANLANSVGGGAYNGTLVNCVLSGNYASAGAGASTATLINCLLATNTAAGAAGGAESCTLNACSLLGNTCGDSGGAANASTLNDCVLSGNWATNSGGGAISCTLNRCQLSGNTANANGGGAYACTLNSCALTGNSTPGAGGGAVNSSLFSCTLTGNFATTGGGADASTLTNCIVYYNRATLRENYSANVTLGFCCTTPLTSYAGGNIDAEPQLTSGWRLSATSPCRAAGSAVFTNGTDIDGQAWANPPSIGCDEFYSGSLVGALSVSAQASYTNVAAGFAVDFTAIITGTPGLSRWDFGDGTFVTNRPYLSHGWTAPGDYTVTLTAYNTSNPGGVSATVVVHVVAQPVHYVAQNNPSPLAPFLSWATAATNIQDAIDTASVPGALVLVTNGTFQTGGRVVSGSPTNRIVLNQPVVVQSVNGPAVTVIQGAPNNDGNAVRCAYLAGGATLSGFTLTGGTTSTDGDASRNQSGAGVWCESSSATVSNCVITGNSANQMGGGAFGGTLVDCVISTNTAPNSGAGAESASLIRCTLLGNSGPDWWGGGGGGAHACVIIGSTLAGNSGYYGGGANSCQLTDCTLTGNSTPTDGGGANNSLLRHCTLTGNSGWSSGGVNGCMLERCSLFGNSAYYGGGAGGSTLRNCVLSGNSARFNAGGADGCVLNNCTLTLNSAGSSCGGASSSTLNNCLVFYNSAPVSPNYIAVTMNYCCAQPLPPGVGNISSDPQLADAFHLSVNSPCRGVGSAAYASGTDLDGEAWVNPPSIGCDELHIGASTGPLSVAISAPYTNVIVGLGLNFSAQISGIANANRWNFGDGTIVSNQPYASHSWSSLGDYPVVLTAFNDSNPGGITATVMVHVVTQPVHYVAISNATPVAPFMTWATAATNIQDAVDAVNTLGALVLVSNGVYQTGARLVNNDVPHRVVVDKPIIVRSVNGPAATIIEGHDWGGPVRCVYLTGGASLCDITLTNGAALAPWSEASSENRTCGGIWCESPTALVSNCVIVACASGEFGGGAYGGTLINCTLLNNSAINQGGGAYGSVLIQCTLLTNYCSWYGYGSGGGAGGCVLDRCVLSGNSADNGGGAAGSTLRNCTLTGNSAGNGGAVDSCSVSNSALLYNLASNSGGGANASQLFNCTLTGNSAVVAGGGVANGTNFNTLVYYNFAPGGSNWVNSLFNSCCTLPLPPSGLGNISAAPQLADAFHLGAGSPCRAAGLLSYTSGTDLDDEGWLNPPAIGCDEYQAGAITGPLAVSIRAAHTNLAAGFPLSLQGIITGHANASLWNFGDGTQATNLPFLSHVWSAPGDYTMTLTAFNETFPAGVSTSLVVHVQSPVHYVMLDNATPVSPYSTWTTAATNIQDAVDATFVGGTIIVSNGVYQTGERVAAGSLSNRVVVTRQMTLQSLNGPAVTTIRGNQPNGPNAVRCLSLVRDCSLSGFTLANGGTRTDGDGDLDQTSGGLWCDSLNVVISNCVITANTANGSAGVVRGTLYNCIISSNSPTGAGNSTLYNCQILGNAGTGAGGCTMTACLIERNSAYDAGGVSGCVLTNCILRGNQAVRYGGASWASTMYNCLIVSNSASHGGGLYNDWAYNCTIVGNSASGYGGGALIASYLANCILYYNSAVNGPDYWSDYVLHCCSSQAYPGNPGNLTNAPLFMNAAAGDFRLQTNSPCINSGNNTFGTSAYDFAGNPRIAGGTVDIGAHEFQTPVSALSYAYLQQYGLPTDGSADYADTDGDGLNNWQEWLAYTIPTSAASVLKLYAPSNSPAGVTVTWQSVSGVNYFLQRSANLTAQPAFSLVESNLVGQPGNTSYTDTNATNGGPWFYRVGVQ